MNSNDIKDALLDGRPVLHNGITYEKVSAVVYRNRNGKIAVSAELLDKNHNCVVVASIDKIQEDKE